MSDPVLEPYREDPSPKRPNLRLRAVILLAILIGGAAYSIRKEPAELHVYTLAADRMLAGDEIYRPDDPKPFTYPPFMAVPFVPLLIFGQDVQKGLFFAINLGIMWWSIALLRRLLTRTFDWRDGPSPWVLAVVIALLTGRQVAASFSNQSHDLFILLSILLGAERLSRGACSGARIFGGAGFGLAAALKATPGLFLVSMGAARRIRAILGFGLAGLFLTLLPDLLFPRDDGKLHGMAWFDTFVRSQNVGGTAVKEGTWKPWNSLNQSLAGSVYRLTHEPPPLGPLDDPRRFPDVTLLSVGTSTAKTITLAMQGLVVALLAWWCRRRRGDDASPRDRSFAIFGDVSLTACAMLLLSPMSSKSHFCVLLLPAAYCVSTWIHRGQSKAILRLLIASFVVGTLTTKGILGKSIGYTVLAAGSVTWATMLMFVAAGVARGQVSPRTDS